MITGLVQGVGFRPFVYRIARKFSLNGYVKNLGGSEVEIVVEGEIENITNFLKALFIEKPFPAKIEKVYIEEMNLGGFNDFKIEKSDKIKVKFSEIPPDFSVCDECLKEVLDQYDRRYRYPFNSCAYCGPRFSMMYSIPYDRENTSMRDFTLCENCSNEYNDPLNYRRFDAQGISCPKCGPSLFLETINGEKIEGDPIYNAGKLLREGYIIAVKGIGGFHIAALAIDDDVVMKLRNRKKRPTQPFAVMAQSLEIIEKYAEVNDYEREVLISPERPIVLLRKKYPYLLSKYVSPGLDREGFFLYYTPLHYLLLNEIPEKLLIMTSGNVHGTPMCIDEECVRKRLKNVVDYILYSNRIIVNRVDDSVVRFSNNRLMFIRRGRGYAPRWIKVPLKFKEVVVAVGAELQNAGAVAFEDKVILTQYIGDTDEYDCLLDLEKAINFFLLNYNLKPKKIVADKNPKYNSTFLAKKLAEKYNAEVYYVQHHYAHSLSSAIDNGYTDGVGIAIDGIGYGDDGNGWGGEVIWFDGTKYDRKFHLKYVPYPGGDISAIYPGRMVIAFLSQFLNQDEIFEIVKSRRIYLKNGEAELRFLLNQIMENKLMTSSLGRVLDAVSSFLGICQVRTYEGEPAMKLEAAARNGKLLDLEIPIINNEIDTIRLFKWLIENTDKRINDLAYTVQYRLGESLVKAALKLNPSRIFVSGGAAVNEYILRGIIDNAEGVEVLTPRRVPAGDGGIALGQVAYVGLLSNEVDK
jgi:hydrogenase maturation protein HypF